MEKFLFICTDTSGGTEPVDVFFKDDRAKGWTSVFESHDRIFRHHKVLLVRAVAAQTEGADASPLRLTASGRSLGSSVE